MRRCRYFTVVLAVAVCMPALAQSADPEPAKQAVQKGKAYFDKGDFDAAIDSFSEAIRLDPHNADAYANRGRALIRSNLEKALADCDEATRLNPKLASAYSTRSVIYAVKRNADKAISDASEAIRLDPNDPRGVCHPRLCFRIAWQVQGGNCQRYGSHSS